MRVLNIGAGPSTNDPARILKGPALSVVGVDIDPVVMTNQELDEAHLIRGDKFPCKDQEFDLGYSDFVFEHVESPGQFLSECFRVLKAGASLFFRTPNLYHYVALGSRLTPHWVHRHLANRMRGLPPDAHETWQTHYRLNRISVIESAASAAGFRSTQLRLFEAEPSYLKFNSVAFLLGVAYERIVNSSERFAGLRVSIMGKLAK